MRKILTVCLILFSLPCFAKEQGFDVPKKIQKRELGPSQYIRSMQINEICSTYDGMALLWKKDPGFKGIERVIVRWGKKPKSLCSTDFTGTTKTIPLKHSSWPLGLSDTRLFVQEEPMGNMANLFVIDIHSGKENFSSWRDLDADLSIEKHDGVVGMTFRMGLTKLPCSPSQGDSKCWQKVKAANAIPDSISIAPPDCEAAFRRYPSLKKQPQGLAISVPVRVQNLSKPKILFQNGRASCRALP